MKKLLFFVRIFDISPCGFTQITSRRDHWMWNLIPHPTSAHTTYFKFHIQQVPTLHTFDRPHYPKIKKYLKNVMMMSSSHFFPGISCFRGSGFHQKYAVWVRVGCGIKFHI